MTNSKMQNARSLNNRELNNLVAFARLLGCVRYFYPSDRAANTNWEQFTISNINKVETARDSTALIAKLKEIFTSIAPTVLIFATEESTRVSAKLEQLESEDSLQLVYIK